MDDPYNMYLYLMIGQALVKIRNFEDAEKMLKRGIWLLDRAIKE